jgi:hypothetical protein
LKIRYVHQTPLGLFPLASIHEMLQEGGEGVRRQEDEPVSQEVGFQHFPEAMYLVGVKEGGGEGGIEGGRSQHPIEVRPPCVLPSLPPSLLTYLPRPLEVGEDRSK